MWRNAEVYFAKSWLLGLCAATTFAVPVATLFTLGTY